jgi:hypothetical protein
MKKCLHTCIGLLIYMCFIHILNAQHACEKTQTHEKNDFHMMISIIKLWKGSKYVICRVVE